MASGGWDRLRGSRSTSSLDSELQRARIGEFIRKGGANWHTTSANSWDRSSSVVFGSDPLGVRPAGPDEANEEIFGQRRLRRVVDDVPRGRKKTDLLPFVDTTAPLSLSQATSMMARRQLGAALPLGGQLRSRRGLSSSAAGPETPGAAEAVREGSEREE